MKILAVSNLYPPEVIGGYELSCQQVVDGLRERGHDVRVLTTVPQVPTSPTEHVLRRMRRPDVFSSDRTQSRSRFWELESNILDSGNVYALVSTVEEFQPDVCYLWNLVGLGGVALVGALEYLGRPWLWHLSDAIPSQLCNFEGRILPIGDLLSSQMSGRFLAVSQGLINEIEHVVSLGTRARLVPNWATDAEGSLRREYYDGTFLRIAFAGQLVEQIGVLIALDAVAEIRDLGYSNFSLDLYGKGDTVLIADRIHQLGLDKFVTLRGWTDQKELRRQFRRHDLFIFPTWAREPFAIVALEAGAEGCVPLLSSPSGDSEWLVEDVHCLKARRDPSAFAATVRRVLDGEVDLAAIGRRAASFVRSEFTLNRVLPVIEEELGAMALQARRPRGSSQDLFHIALITEAMARRSLSEAALR